MQSSQSDPRFVVKYVSEHAALVGYIQTHDRRGRYGAHLLHARIQLHAIAERDNASRDLPPHRCNDSRRESFI